MADAARTSRRGLVATALAVVLVPGALLACDPPPRESGQWPIALAELAPAQAAADPGEAAYRRTCIACHGADGKGNGEKTGADFTRPDGRLTKPDDALLVSIRSGTRGPIGIMPAHQGLLTDTETTAVLAYVRRTFGPSIVPSAASAAQAEPSPSSNAPAR